MAFLHWNAKTKGDSFPVRPLHSIQATVDGALIYCIGDVHGRYDLLLELLRQIVDDAHARRSGRRPILIFCGDYIDRGPQSSKVLAALLWLQRDPSFETHFLMGNHEAALLDFMAAPDNAAAWLRYGGIETLMSYGVSPPAPGGGHAEILRCRNDLLDSLPASHLHLLRNLDMIVTIGGVAFVHAGVKPRVSLEAQKPDDLLWIREEFLDWKGGFDKLIVHGHTWYSEEVEILADRIGVDTGAYKTSVLSAVRLEDREAAIFQTSLSAANGRDVPGAL